MPAQILATEPAVEEFSQADQVVIIGPNEAKDISVEARCGNRSPIGFGVFDLQNSSSLLSCMTGLRGALTWIERP
jgi:hypothetical protein